MNIVTFQQLQSLQDTTCVMACVIFAIAVGCAFLVANLIPYRSDGKSYITRRIWFVIIGLVFVFGFFLYNDLVQKARIVNAGWASMYENTNLMCLAITTLGYVISSVILMFIFRTSKFGSILGKIKK